MTESERQIVLERLIRAEGRMSDVVRRSQDFSWDSEHEVVTLGSADALRILRRFIAGSMSNDELEIWADAIEGRDDIGLEPASKLLLSDLLFELANPALTEPITREAAQSWLNRFDAAK